MSNSTLIPTIDDAENAERRVAGNPVQFASHMPGHIEADSEASRIWSKLNEQAKAASTATGTGLEDIEIVLDDESERGALDRLSILGGAEITGTDPNSGRPTIRLVYEEPEGGHDSEEGEEHAAERRIAAKPVRFASHMPGHIEADSEASRIWAKLNEQALAASAANGSGLEDQEVVLDDESERSALDRLAVLGGAEITGTDQTTGRPTIRLVYEEPEGGHDSEEGEEHAAERRIAAKPVRFS